MPTTGSMTLPEIVVEADPLPPPDTGDFSNPVRGGTSALPPGFIPQTVIDNRHIAMGYALFPGAPEVYGYAADGDSLSAFAYFLNSLNARSSDVCETCLNNIDFVHRSTMEQDANASFRPQPGTWFNDLFRNGADYALSFGEATGNSTSAPPIENFEYDFYGWSFLPFIGLYYWLFGGGVTRTLNIDALRFRPTPRDFEQVDDILNSNPNPGSYPIDSEFTYNFFDDLSETSAAALTLGRVSGRVRGLLNVNSNGDFTLEATYSLNSDVYDANLGGRDFFQERLTEVLDILGRVFGSDDYTIIIGGEGTVRVSGNIND